MKQPTSEQIVLGYAPQDEAAGGALESYNPGTQTWGQYTKGSGWTSLKVFTGKAVREWVQSKIAALYNRLSSFQVQYSDFTVGEGERLVQSNKTVTIKDGEENTLCSFNTIVLDKVTVKQYTLVFNTTFEDVVVQPIIVEEGNSVTLPIPTKTGKVFLGWLYNSNTYSGSFTPTGNTLQIEFTASWRDDSANQLIMYSFETQQSSNFTNSEVTTPLVKNQENLISNNRLYYHYIPSLVAINVMRSEFGVSGTVELGEYDDVNHVYKIENKNLIDEYITYN